MGFTVVPGEEVGVPHGEKVDSELRVSSLSFRSRRPFILSAQQDHTGALVFWAITWLCHLQKP